MRSFKSLQNLISTKQNKTLFKSIIKVTDLKKDIKKFFKNNNLNILIVDIDLKKNLITIKCKSSIQVNSVRLLQNNLTQTIKKNLKIITKISS